MHCVLRNLSRITQRSLNQCRVPCQRGVASSAYRLSSSRVLQCATVFGVAGTAIALTYRRRVHVWAALDKDVAPSTDQVEYSKEDVARHNTVETGVWVTYQGSVYDITQFIESHPGGSSKIILAAGGALEPFWSLYAFHKKDEILEMLNSYKIGKLKPSDMNSEVDVNDPYGKEPERLPAFLVRSQKPFNAETPPQLLLDHFNTPNDLFYVRNHLPVPSVDEDSYCLEISGVGLKKSVKLTLDDLKSKFPKQTISATIQCAGNRRAEMVNHKPVKGLYWEGTAIGNARWSGASLYDVLKYAELTEEGEKEINHVEFIGLDHDMTNTPYMVSIPASKALNRRGDVLLAYEMNGEEIPRDHGYPVRAVVPGVVGARNVKWLGKIVTRTDESNGHWQQNDYKGFSPCIDWHNVDFKSAQAIQELPVQSAICEPCEGADLRGHDEVTIRGYAFSGGGRGIVRVDVSADGGKSWHVAELKQHKQPDQQAWAWTLWKADIPLPETNDSKTQLICKAIDTAYNTQPDTVEPIWNLRGVLNTSWHRVSVNIGSEE